MGPGGVGLVWANSYQTWQWNCITNSDICGILYIASYVGAVLSKDVSPLF